MKPKYCTGILLLLLLSSSTAKAQRDKSGGYINDNGNPVVNNYYVDNDYYFASRINRFHRPYSMFDYYSPLFTDPYFYNHRPFSLGFNFFAGRGLGLGFSLNFPIYNYGCGYGNYYGYDPYFGSGYYWDYDPFYYSSWYSPFMFSLNFNLWSRWHNNYFGWNGYNHSHNMRHYDYRPGYYANNDSRGYNSNRRLSPDYPSRRNSGNISRSSIHNNTVSGREISPGNYSRNSINTKRPAVRSNNSLKTGENRRYLYAGLNNSRTNNNIKQGVNYGRYEHSNNAITKHSSGTMNASQVHSSPSRSLSVPRMSSSSSRSMSSGSGIKGISSHGGSRSSGSSRGKSSGRR
jgi:hypothetical protein